MGHACAPAEAPIHSQVHPNRRGLSFHCLSLLSHTCVTCIIYIIAMSASHDTHSAEFGSCCRQTGAAVSINIESEWFSAASAFSFPIPNSHFSSALSFAAACALPLPPVFFFDDLVAGQQMWAAFLSCRLEKELLAKEAQAAMPSM